MVEIVVVDEVEEGLTLAIVLRLVGIHRCVVVRHLHWRRKRVAMSGSRNLEGNCVSVSRPEKDAMGVKVEKVEMVGRRAKHGRSRANLMRREGRGGLAIRGGSGSETVIGGI